MLKTVRSKFSLVYISLVLVIVLLGVVSIYTLTEINSTIEGLITTNYNSIQRLNNMRNALWQQDRNLSEYLYGLSHVDAAKNYYLYAEKFTESYEAERATIIIPAEQEYIDSIGSNYERYLETFEHLKTYNINSALQLEEAVAYYEDTIRAQQTEVENAMEKLKVSNEIALFGRRDEASQSARNAISISAVVFFAVAVIGYLLATMYTRRFFAPLYEITENVKQVRKGNLNRKITVYSPDEFGMLAEEFNNMTQRLGDFERATLGTLASERNRSDLLVKSINEPVIVLDENGSVLLMNRAFERLYGLNEETSVNLPLGHLLPGSDFDEFYTALKNQQSNFPAEKTITVTAMDADTVYYHAATAPIPGPEGRIAGLILILHDITEIKRLDKTRGDYIATISHEFKTPLTSIVMGVDLLLDERMGSLNGDQEEIVDTIKEDTQRLERLVSEILELSKIESSKMLYRFDTCFVDEIISTSVRQFKPFADRQGIDLCTRLPDKLHPVRADFSKITWVLNNLLSNAFKYTADGGRVEIDVTDRGDHIEVSVSDTGEGVPAEFADQIFEKYVQIKGYDIEMRGSGLGLSAAKEIISAHDGSIWCDPTYAGGSRFVFTLKTVKGEAAQ